MRKCLARQVARREFVTQGAGRMDGKLMRVPPQTTKSAARSPDRRPSEAPQESAVYRNIRTGDEVTPVTKSDAELARNAAIPAKSSGVPSRPAAVRASPRWCSAALRCRPLRRTGN